MMNINRYFSIAERRGFFNWMPTEMYLKYKYRRCTGKKLNLVEPKTFNEKLQKYKIIFSTSPQLASYTMMTDKLLAKDYVAEKIGSEHIIPTIGVWDHFSDIVFDTLPDQFVLKTNHDSGGVVICQDKTKLDMEQAKKKLEKNLKLNFYWYGREPQYKNIIPKLFAEKYMLEKPNQELKDYKIFCFDGQPKLIQVDFDRFSNHRRNLYTLDWKYVNASIKYPTDPSYVVEKPDCLNEMLEYAKILSTGIPHVRTDFYIVNGHVYFGELTFFHGSGYELFSPESFEKEFSSWLRLPM